MSWITVNADIDIDEFLSSCHRKDIKYIIECLVEDGHLDESVIRKETIQNTISDIGWEINVEKLKNNKHLLTIDEENLILNITNKLI